MTALPDGWSDLPFFSERYPAIAEALESDGREILPPKQARFRALALCPPEAVRAVILGQDPYPTPGHADGLAFSVAPEVSPLPMSLRNIYKELHDDTGEVRQSGDLTDWAAQGVLLLNTSLTVAAGDKDSHKVLGWSQLVSEVLDRLMDRPRAFILWGKPAQKVGAGIGPSHLVIRSAHPSPLSARRGFFGSRPFSRVNDWLASQGQPGIIWGH